VQSVVELTPLTIERSVQAMLEAHKSGVALLLVTHKERAELYCEQFRTKKLIVTMEEA
jgi:ATP-dependent Clp protease adapter protein ClpS